MIIKDLLLGILTVATLCSNARGLLKRGWYNPNNGFQYALTKEKFNYEKAREECQGWHGELAHFGIRDKFIFEKLTKQFQDEEIWIGLDDQEREGKFVWNDGLPIRSSWKKFWHKGEPGSAGDCVVLSNWPCRHDKRKLWAQDCEVERFGLCELKVGTPPAYMQHTTNGITYALVTMQTTYAQAKIQCENWDGYLAVDPVLDETIAQFLMDEFSFMEMEYPSPWVGLNDIQNEGTFEFESLAGGPPPTYDFDASKVQSNSNRSDCAAFFSRTNGEIRMTRCNRKYAILCQKPVVQTDDTFPDNSCLPQVGPCNNTFPTCDGSCNNRLDERRGMRGRAFKRLLPPAYANGQDNPRDADDLPSPRAVTQAIRDTENPSSGIADNSLVIWGQLLAHDLSRTPESSVTCTCGSSDPECFNIAIGDDDPMKTELDCLVFTRSRPIDDVNCQSNVRQQENLESAYIDASFAYGSTAEHAAALRATEASKPGELLVGNTSSPDPDSLPFETVVHSDVETDCPVIHKPVDKPCFAAGDPRVSEQPGLTANHLAIVRKHNQIVAELRTLNPTWNSEKLYETARSIVAAFTQHITYNEFLPTVLGPLLMKRFGLELTEKEFYYGYNAKFDATISNSFATAAMRFGHTLVNGSPNRQSPDFNTTVESMPLETHFFNNEPFYQDDAEGSILRGMLNDKALKYDSVIVTPLLDQLFVEDGNQFGGDLLAFNLQRGRDHGLPSYLEFRRFCGLKQDLSDIPQNVQDSLLEVYEGDESLIDLFIGGISENSVKDGILGPTFACIIAYQFRDLRRGDANWYENGASFRKFTRAQLRSIKEMTLARLVCDVSSTMETIQPLAMKQDTVDGNSRVACSDIPTLDLSPWQENAASAMKDKDADLEWTLWLPIHHLNDNVLPLSPFFVIQLEASVYRPDDVCDEVKGHELRKVKGHYQVRFLCPAGSIMGTDFPPVDAKYVYWTSWTNQDSSATSGDDDETLSGSGACLKPVAIQAQSVDGVPARETGDVFECLSPQEGLLCRGDQQESGHCKDYRVRYLCLNDVGLA